MKIHIVLLFLLAKIIGLVPFSLTVDQHKAYSSLDATFYISLVRIVILYKLYKVSLLVASLWHNFHENLELILILIAIFHHIINFIFIHIMQFLYKNKLIKLINEGINIWISISRFLLTDRITFSNYILNREIIKVYKIKITLSILHIFGISFWFIWTAVNLPTLPLHFFLADPASDNILYLSILC